MSNKSIDWIPTTLSHIWRMASLCSWQRSCLQMEQPIAACTSAQEAELRSRTRAIELDRNDALVLALCGHVAAILCGRRCRGRALLSGRIDLNPNLALWLGIHGGCTESVRDKPEKAIERSRTSDCA